MEKGLILLLCLCLTICCTACAFHTEANPTERFSDPTTEPTYKVFVDNMPYKLDFASFDELVELWQMQYADEETVNEYLWDFESRSFLVNGLESREHIVQLFDKIGKWEIPYIAKETGFQLKKLSYSPDRGTLHIEYCTSSPTKWNEFLKFWYNPNYDLVIDYEAVGSITIAGETVVLYDDPDYVGTYELRGEVGTNPRMVVDYSAKHKTLDEIQNDVAQYITLITLEELIAQFQAEELEAPQQ